MPAEIRGARRRDLSARRIAREDLNVMADGALGHYTHERNPVACAAGLAAIDVIERDGLLDSARALGAYAVDRMRAMMADQTLIGDVRGLGLLMGMELVKDRASMERAADEAEQVMYRALAKGLSFKLTMGNVVTLTPALTITRPEMDQGLDILEACVKAVERGVRRPRG